MEEKSLIISKLIQIKNKRREISRSDFKTQFYSHREIVIDQWNQSYMENYHITKWHYNSVGIRQQTVMRWLNFCLSVDLHPYLIPFIRVNSSCSTASVSYTEFRWPWLYCCLNSQFDGYMGWGNISSKRVLNQEPVIKTRKTKIPNGHKKIIGE